MQLSRVKNDVNGNGRFVVHFLDLVTNEDRAEAPEVGRIPWLIARALERSRKIGGQCYRGKSIAGGIVFQESSEELLRQNIAAIVKGGKP
jgi:hypothetical protein